MGVLPTGPFSRPGASVISVSSQLFYINPSPCKTQPDDPDPSCRVLWTSSSRESLTPPPALRTGLCRFLGLISCWGIRSYDDRGQGQGRGNSGLDVRPTWAPPLLAPYMLGETLDMIHGQKPPSTGPNYGCCYGYPRLYRILLVSLPITQKAKLCRFSTVFAAITSC